MITNVEMEEMAAAGKITRPSDGSPVKNVLFIQCAGSRDPEHLPYCSAACCLVSMKQAAYVKEQNAEAVNYVLYKDVRTVGQAEDFYRKSQEDGSVFIRGAATEVGEAGGKLFVKRMMNSWERKSRLKNWIWSFWRSVWCLRRSPR